MTNEEAIYIIDHLKPQDVKSSFDSYTVGKALTMANAALKAKPKTGHWIKIKPYPLQMHDYECSECGHETDDNTENYCSDCGAKMVKAESEEKIWQI